LIDCYWFNKIALTKQTFANTDCLLHEKINSSHIHTTFLPH